MNEEVQAMVASQITKADEKLSAAKALLKDGYFDDSVSRSYYAVFHAASAALLSEGIEVQTHSALKTMFGLHFIKAGLMDQMYGKYLSKLKDERENGDYDIFSTLDKEDADQAVQEAEAFIDAIKRYLDLSAD